MSIFVRLLILGMLLLPGVSFAQTPPHLPRTGANLVPNPNFNGTSNWYVPSPAVYDATQSRTPDGTGSMRLPMWGRIDPVATIPVTAGKQYILAGYIKVTSFPPPSVEFDFYTVNCGGGSSSHVSGGGPTANSQSNIWEEFSVVITPTTTGCMTFSVSRVKPDRQPDQGTQNAWVDEIYWGEGFGFGSPPAPRVAFDGATVKVDVLGNVQVKRDGGAWEDFFPFCIMSDLRRPNAYQYYSSLGFNCDGRGGGGSNLTLAKNATSTFNPKGIMMVTDLSSYMYQCSDCGGWDAGHINLTNYINEIKNASARDRMLWWYFDNEVIFTNWQMVMDSIASLNATDRIPVTTGQRLFPMFILQGSFNMTHGYRRASDGWQAPEITGTYADATNSGGAGYAGGFDILMNQQNQTLPASIVNANIVTIYTAPGTLRGALYKFLGRGMRAWTMWRDCYRNDCGGSANPLHTVPWLPDVPNLRRELDAMLPLIRQPHWTNWTVTHTGGNNLHVGTRDYAGNGHLIIVNDTAASKTVTFTLSGLCYTPQTVVNFFTGATVAAVTGGNTFTITLPAVGINSGSAVLRITGTSTILPCQLLVNWPFDEGTGTTADDIGTASSPQPARP